MIDPEDGAPGDRSTTEAFVVNENHPAWLGMDRRDPEV